ncbi:MAG: hypothetical protein EXR59_03950 [Dehalococcoidia bacterium]|nr:hypothetical protein [Dehalococcoidia bacterium]
MQYSHTTAITNYTHTTLLEVSPWTTLSQFSTLRLSLTSSLLWPQPVSEGFIAAQLKQPVIIGYLVAGVVVGPNTPGVTADSANLQFFSELGIAFLLFVMGAENGPDKFRSVGKAIVIAGVGKLPFTILLGIGMGLLLGFDIRHLSFRIDHGNSQQRSHREGPRGQERDLQHAGQACVRLLDSRRACFYPVAGFPAGCAYTIRQIPRRIDRAG